MHGLDGYEILQQAPDASLWVLCRREAGAWPPVADAQVPVTDSLKAN